MFCHLPSMHLVTILIAQIPLLAPSNYLGPNMPATTAASSTWLMCPPRVRYSNENVHVSRFFFHQPGFDEMLHFLPPGLRLKIGYRKVQRLISESLSLQLQTPSETVFGVVFYQSTIGYIYLLYANDHSKPQTCFAKRVMFPGGTWLWSRYRSANGGWAKTSQRPCRFCYTALPVLLDTLKLNFQ